MCDNNIRPQCEQRQEDKWNSKVEVSEEDKRERPLAVMMGRRREKMQMRRKEDKMVTAVEEILHSSGKQKHKRYKRDRNSLHYDTSAKYRERREYNI